MTSNQPELPQISVPLRDGSVAQLRPLAPEDRARLVEGLSRMSEQSRFARFGSGISNLSDSELRYLTEVDQVTHVAWGAIIEDQPAGVGRYIVGEDAVAEIAVTVVDEYQRKGLGRVLFDALVASARASGIEELRFSIEPWNKTVVRMFPGVDVVLDERDGMLTGRVEVSAVPAGPHESEYVELLDLCRRGWPAV